MRQTILFNDDWKFLKDDPAGAHAADFDASSWRDVILPHDWSIEGPFDQRWASATGYLPGGVGWYRKEFAAPDLSDGRHAVIRFDGVYCNSEVWINGRYLGKRPNGFIGFEYDLTPYLVEGANALAVRVDHTHFGDSRWYTGSGIYRNAYLVVQDRVHIAPWGVFATTPAVTPEMAEVRVETVVENQGAAEETVRIRWTLADPSGGCVAEGSEDITAQANSTRTALAVLTVAAPELWSVATPSLYHLRTEVLRGETLIDRDETRIGIRAFRFDADRGFFLNGENLKLKGVCVHDDAGALGVAVPPKVWRRRLQILKDAGVNAIRMAHNPHMPELYDLCDEMGFLVQDEAFDEWELGKNKWIAGWNAGHPGRHGYAEHFENWAERDLADMILRDGNHPSVIMWSIGNEIDYPNDPYSHELLDTGTNPQIYGRGYEPDRPHSDRLGLVARRLAALVKRYDTSRPVTAALSAAMISNETGFADALDIVGYNYQEYRYAEDHARYPGRVLYGSENGMHWEQWQAVEDNPYISAQFLWTGIDYLGEAGRWPTRSNGAGLLDLAGFPKPEYYFRQSLWSEKPMIFLGTRAIPRGEEQTNIWSHKRAEPVWCAPGSVSLATPNNGDSEPPIIGAGGLPVVRVVCFTNCERAELLLNGRSLGVKALADAAGHVLWWDVPYEPGALAARGLDGDEIVSETELRTSGPAARILASTDEAAIRADGIDLAHIAAVITDANGVPVYRADHEICWTVEGPARLLGLESGDPNSHEDYRAQTRRAFHGKLLGYVQSTGTPGEIVVRLTADGLEDAVVTVRAE